MTADARAGRLLWFASLPAPIRDALVARGRQSTRPAGAWVYGEGDEDTGVVGVLSGGLYIYAQAPGGREALVSVLPSGGVIGQSIAFGGGPRLITAVCAVESEVFVLPDRALREAAAAHPALWQSIGGLVYAQLRTNLRSLTEFIALSPRARLVSRLHVLSSLEKDLPVTQSALAEIVGASRNAVNQWLGELEEAGCIERGYRRLRVVNRRALARQMGADAD